MKNKRVEWADVAKLWAMLAVIVNHTVGSVYHNTTIAYSSYYSVSLFIVVMGVTSYWSFSRYQGNRIDKIKSGCWKILRPYLVATFLYKILLEQHFDFLDYLDKVVHFNEVGPFYYVLLYIQLFIAAPILYYVFVISDKKKYGILIELLGLVITAIVGAWTTYNTNILDIYGGGGKLLGGTYLILLYIGMMFGKYCNRIQVGKAGSIVLLVFSIVIMCVCLYVEAFYRGVVDAYFPFGDGINPPSVSSGLCAVSIMFFVFMVEKVIGEISALKTVFGMFARIGRHTLYVFLYHMLMINYCSDIVNAINSEMNIWFKVIIFFGGIFAGSFVIELIVEKALNFIHGIYFEKKSVE